MSARSKLICDILALVALVMLAAGPARTADLRAAPIADSELEEARGGFVVDGIQFNFGAELKTMVNGQLAFETQVTWTAAGAQVTQKLGQNATQGAAASGAIKGLNMQGLSPDQIAMLNNGATAVIQKVTGGAVQNIVLNTASGQTISQSTQLNLDLPGFSQTQQLFQQNLAMLHLLQATQAGLASVPGR